MLRTQKTTVLNQRYRFHLTCWIIQHRLLSRYGNRQHYTVRNNQDNPGFFVGNTRMLMT